MDPSSAAPHGSPPPTPAANSAAKAAQHAPHPGCPDNLTCLADSDSKPRDTFATIIRCAILSTPSKRMTLNCIYNAIEEKYPYYRDAGPGWKNTVRHVLSTSHQFEKSRRPITEPGKGGYWSVNKLPGKPDTPRNRRSNRANAAAATTNAAGTGGATARSPQPLSNPATARKDLPPTAEQPAAPWTPATDPGVQDYPYMRPLSNAPPPDQPSEPDARSFPSQIHPSPVSQVGPISPYQEPPHQHPPYHLVQQMPHMQPLPQFQQPNSIIYSYDKPPERPGWLPEVSWGNAPMSNVTATNGRQ